MKFWDSSALVPLLIEEATSAALQQLYLQDGGAIAWWGSEIECGSAIARLERQQLLSAQAAGRALQALRSLARSWQEITPADIVRDTAVRFLRVHDLRAGDSLQLAAALVAAESRPPTLPFVSLDARLSRAAQREGFPVLGPDELGLPTS